MEHTLSQDETDDSKINVEIKYISSHSTIWNTNRGLFMFRIVVWRPFTSDIFLFVTDTKTCLRVIACWCSNKIPVGHLKRHVDILSKHKRSVATGLLTLYIYITSWRARIWQMPHRRSYIILRLIFTLQIGQLCMFTAWICVTIDL